jgi:hypothetical protein
LRVQPEVNALLREAAATGRKRALPLAAECDAEHDGDGEEQQSDERALEKALEDHAVREAVRGLRWSSRDPSWEE